MRRYLPHALIFIVAATVQLTGLLERADHFLMDWRLRASDRAASGDIVIVEIDERSLRQLNVWPCPRRYHAQLIERLTDANAAMIAIDVDFSSPSTPADDAALAQALTDAGGRVVLPVFRQLSGHKDAKAAIETGPHGDFLSHVQLGSVVARPEADGLARRAITAMPFENRIVPSISALLSGTTVDSTSAFYVDYSTDPATLPRISYVDAMRGNFAPNFFAGRRVLVGSTALELGDRLPVPLHISLPGPHYLALAAESMVQNRRIIGTGPLPTLVVGLILAFILGPRLVRWSWKTDLAVAGSVTAALIGGATVLQIMAPVSVDIAAWLVILWLSFAHGLVVKIDRQAIHIFRQRMAMVHRSNMMRQVVESSFDGIIAIDQTGRISIINPAAAQMFGYAPDELAHSKVWRLMRLANETTENSLQGLLTTDNEPPQALTGIGVRKGGQTFDVELSVRRVQMSPGRHVSERRAAARAYLFLTVRDIKARRQMEEEREHAAAAAEAANRAKSEFLAAVSHELRTPLNAIIGFSEMMNQEMLGPLGNATCRGYVEDIHRSGAHLLSIVNDILDVSRIEAGRHELKEEPVDIADVAETCKRLIRGRPEAQGLAIDIAIPEDLPRLIADARSVKQILLNLLSNAVKFTNAGTVAVTAAIVEDGAIQFSVTDTGIGIPAEEIEKVLYPFNQVDSSLGRQFEGTGLGLGLVASLLELHGGALAIDSVVGEGTTVSCRFPPERTQDPASMADVA